MSNVIQYFTNWINNTEVNSYQTNVTRRVQDSYCLSKITYHNILTLVMGFIGYTKSILESSPRTSLISTLHSNQSSIENLFSCIRRMSKDRTDKYASGIIEQNLHKSIKYDAIPRGNASYPSSMIVIETNRLIDPNGISTEKRLGETVNQYKELVRLMIQKQGVAKINDDESFLFPSTSQLQPRLIGFDMFHMLTQHALKDKKNF